MTAKPNHTRGKAARYWAVVPAAGIGTRMGAELLTHRDVLMSREGRSRHPASRDISTSLYVTGRRERPKQYLTLRGKCVIEHCLDRLTSHPKISGVVVALGPDDADGANLVSRPAWNGKPLYRVAGGEQRCHSVLNALSQLADIAAGDDWVLVHDAVRPCLRHSDIDKLINTLAEHPVGGLLGVPLSDTIKRVATDHRVIETVNRAELWRALTPQMFRLAALTRALTEAIESGIEVTDDAAAMSLTGAVPVVIEGHADNIKITHPADLALAEFYLAQQEQSL